MRPTLRQRHDMIPCRRPRMRPLRVHAQFTPADLAAPAVASEYLSKADVLHECSIEHRVPLVLTIRATRAVSLLPDFIACALLREFKRMTLVRTHPFSEVRILPTFLVVGSLFFSCIAFKTTERVERLLASARHTTERCDVTSINVASALTWLAGKVVRETSSLRGLPRNTFQLLLLKKQS